jgi:hypothetical protein
MHNTADCPTHSLEFQLDVIRRMMRDLGKALDEALQVLEAEVEACGSKAGPSTPESPIARGSNS